ncbi:MAG TPA: FAD-binding oxidoreductase [Bryobacteraceae bacterium]|nr:FAD-binding oxidoreductase [Bryobacteraceae bacterium]
MDVTDASGYPGHADQVLSPETEQEVADLLRQATERKVPVTATGALTGLAGGASPQGGWAISLARLRKLEVSPGCARVGPGVLLRDVQAAAANSGQFYAPDPTENTSSIGGNIAANASGSRSFRYGATRRHVLAVNVASLGGGVFPSGIRTIRRGERVDFDVPAISLPRTTKFSAGYPLAPGLDLIDLIIGSEGTLGLVTEAELQLLPAPGERLSGVVFFASEEAALEAVDLWRPTPGLNMIEYLDEASLQMMDVPHQAALMIEIEGDADIDLSGALEADSWFATSAADRERFRVFRHGVAERVNARVRRTGFTKIGTDYAVPLDRNREMMAAYRRTLDREMPGKYAIYGHIGDAHVHVNAFPSSQEEYDRGVAVMTDLARVAVSLGGTVGAEHGLGKRKTHLLEIQYAPDQIEAMKNVKRRFDPDWLLGRGTLFAYPAA